jgi:outer membrane protein assembly factor BamB
MEINDISYLHGKTLSKVERVGDEEIIFTTTDGRSFKLYHERECCESVYIEDICGDLQDLVGSPLLLAEEVSNATEALSLILPVQESSDESFTWTYYRLATIKGAVSIRFYGTSNGYYSEAVYFAEIT